MPHAAVEITYEDQGSKGRYVARIAGVEGEGELTLSKLSETLVITGGRMTGQGVIASGIMILHLVVKGPDHGALVHMLSHSW